MFYFMFHVRDEPRNAYPPPAPANRRPPPRTSIRFPCATVMTVSPRRGRWRISARSPNAAAGARGLPQDGISPEAVYELARRPDGQSFRVAWEIALDIAVRRVSDEAFSRCINGVVVPHYYKGGLVGEHRRYDERLTMFILRYRDPQRYGRHLDRQEPGGHREEQPLTLGEVLAWVEQDARRDATERPR